MPKPDRSTGKVRFGDFELDLRAAEFHREGKGTIRLPEQPFQILAMLLERPGEVVSQEEIRKRLWPNDTIAEFEHSISAAMNRVRQALGDSANDPDYIETLPRRGYRWKVAVEWVAAPPAADGAPRPKTASRVPVTVLFALVLLTIGAGLSAWLWSRSMAQPPVKISLATTLAGFERNPSFSPDGNEIAFVHFDTDTRDLNIFVKTLGDERVVQLTHTPPPGASDCPSWSPDGTTIAYNRSIETSATTSVAAIFLMTARGGSQRQLRPVSSDASCQMSWAPDSKSLAYGDAPPGQNPGIFLIPSSGSPVRRLTTAPPTTTDGDPAFSPDGTEVASIRWSSSTTSDLYRASTTNGQITRVTVLNRRVVSPVWTSDGKRLIFGINGGFWGTNALFSVATTSAEPESLPFISSPSVFTPALSRQEDKLAFATGFFDTNIWNIPLREPAAPHSIAPATQDKWPSPNKVIVSTRMEMQPQLSPNGTRLAYVSDRDGAMALWLSKPDGSDPIRLASAPLGGTPDWSPDGNNIVFDTAESGSGEIYVTSADGGIPTQITSGHFENGAATWSADGKWIYFDSKRSGHWEIWKTAFPGKNDAVQVTTHGGGYAQEATDGKFIYYQKPASDAISQMLPQIWRMASGGGAEDPVVSVGEPMSDCCSWFWRVTAEGIYFIDNAARPLPVIKRFTFATGNVKVLAQLEKKTGAVPVCRSLPTVAQRSKLNWTIRAAIFCWLNTSIEICYSPAFAANASTTTMFCRNCCGRPCRSSKYAGVL